MKKILLLFFLLFNIHSAICHSKQSTSIPRNVLQPYILEEFFSGYEIEVADNTLGISIILSEEEEQSMKGKLAGMYSPEVKESLIESIDKLGSNSAPYSTLDFGKEVYSRDNPFFSIQKGQLAYAVGTDPKLSKITDIVIVYKSADGNSFLIQIIDERLKGIARRLSDMGVDKKETAMLIAEKEGIDAGVIKNKELTPYQIDLLSIMEEIELTDESYIYYVSVPKHALDILSAEEYYSIAKDLEKQLGDYIRPMNFFKKKEAEIFELKIEYVYKDSKSGEEFIKYVFNPFTGQCEIIPISKDYIEKFRKASDIPD